MVFISKNLHLTKIPSRSEADIVVAKKKLDSIREWISNSEQPGASRIMLITGPSGSGKSAAVRLVAAETNLELHEWCAPVPTLWEDFRYIDLPSASYTSKVDEFLAFIARAFRYSPLDLGLETRVGEHKDKGKQVSKITGKKFCSLTTFLSSTIYSNLSEFAQFCDSLCVRLCSQSSSL